MSTSSSTTTAATPQEGAGLLRRGTYALFGWGADVWSSVRSAGTAVTEISKCPYFQQALGRDGDPLTEESKAEMMMRCPYAKAGASLPANHPMIPGMMKPPTETAENGIAAAAALHNRSSTQSSTDGVQQAMQLDAGAGASRFTRPQAAAGGASTTTPTRIIPFAHTQEAQAVALFKKAAATSASECANDGLSID